MKARVRLVEGLYRVTRGRGTVVACETKACAEYVAELLDRHGGFAGAFERIHRALVAERDGLTCYPPRGAGDVIGAP